MTNKRRSLRLGRAVVVLLTIGSVAAASIIHAQATSAQTKPAATQPATTAPSAASNPPGSPKPEFPDKFDRVAEVAARFVAEAHQKSIWSQKAALQAEVVLEFGGKTEIDAKLQFQINRERIRVERKDGTTLIFDGRSSWISPAAATVEPARFALRAWPIFVAAPFKLQDPGRRVTAFKSRHIQGRQIGSFTLTLDRSAGDAPHNWHIVYFHPPDRRIYALAHIIPSAKPEQMVEPEPLAIVYDKYEQIDGVLLPSQWTFYRWKETEGVVGDPLGKATLSNIAFVKPADDAFEKPADAREYATQE